MLTSPFMYTGLVYISPDPQRARYDATTLRRYDATTLRRYDATTLRLCSWYTAAALVVQPHVHLYVTAVHRLRARTHTQRPVSVHSGTR